MNWKFKSLKLKLEMVEVKTPIRKLYDIAYICAF